MGWFSSSGFDTGKSSRCFYEKLKGTCGSCENMNPDNYVSGFFSGYKYRCEEMRNYTTWDDSTCRRLKEVDPGRVDCVERYYKFSGRKYFILSAIFEILGFNMNNCVYKKIAAIIDFVREDSSTEVEAIEYEIVGMDIANKLRKDENRVEICNELFQNYIMKIYQLIECDKIFESVDLYKEMVKKLFVYYNNQEKYNQIIDANLFTKTKKYIK